MRKIFMILLFLTLPLSSFAWDSVGHRIIAAIAYDNLTPQTKAKVAELTAVIDKGYPPYARFLYIAALPDIWRQAGIKYRNNWHFIDLPWSTDGTPTQSASSPNLVTVFDDNTALLSDPLPSKQKKAIALAFLEHLTGDAHQPLHASQLFSKEFPNGDRGGNLFTIKSNDESANLHSFWDRASIFLGEPKWHYPYSNKQITRLAQQIEENYSLSAYSIQVKDVDIKSWTQQSFELAKSSVYTIAPNTIPSANYIKMVKEISSKQFALAGYRLAYILNSIYDKK